MRWGKQIKGISLIEVVVAVLITSVMLAGSVGITHYLMFEAPFDMSDYMPLLDTLSEAMAIEQAIAVSENTHQIVAWVWDSSTSSVSLHYINKEYGQVSTQLLPDKSVIIQTTTGEKWTIKPLVKPMPFVRSMDVGTNTATITLLYPALNMLSIAPAGTVICTGRVEISGIDACYQISLTVPTATSSYYIQLYSLDGQPHTATISAWQPGYIEVLQY